MVENFASLQEYIACLEYNRITRYLHTIRYRHLIHFLQSLPATLSEIESKHRHIQLFEIGCGYGKSIEAIKLFNMGSQAAEHKKPLLLEQYFGIDIDPAFAAYCQKKFPDPNHQFKYADIRSFVQGKETIPFKPNAMIALECFEHIHEADVPSILEWMASLRIPVFISVPNELGPALAIKNLGSALMGYVRHKEYRWQETWYASRYQLERLPAHQTGHIGFDWRWLAAVIHQKFNIVKIGTSPFDFVPRFLSPSIYFYCLPR